MKNYKDIPGARLATDRYDFQEHIDGVDFKHKSNGILVDPAILIDQTYCGTVASALDAISAYIQLDKTNGVGFTAIGDGYDTYHTSLETPDTPYDALVPSLDAALNDLLNNPLNERYHRIRAGGVVLIKAGTYKFTDTVNVPPGIIIMGEGYGTKIINQTPTPRPLFKIKADLTRVADNGVDVNEAFMFARKSVLTNLTIADNFVEPKFLGDLSYLDPQNYDSINPLVALEEGGALAAIGVKFVGKTKYVLSVLNQITSFAIATDATVPLASGTQLDVRDCVIDGFSQAVRFNPSGAVKNYLNFTQNKVRCYGHLNNDLVGFNNNSFVFVNDVNVSMQDNYLYGFLSTVYAGLYVDNTATSPIYQAKARMLVSNNTASIDRTYGGVNTSFVFAYSNASVGTDYSILEYGNTFANNNDFELYANGNLWLKLQNDSLRFSAPNNLTIQTGFLSLTTGYSTASTGTIRLENNTSIMARDAADTYDYVLAQINSQNDIFLGHSLRTTPQADTYIWGAQINKTWLVSTTSYTVDSGATRDYIILVDTSAIAAPITINLPPAPDAGDSGRVIIIKDCSGAASLNNITLTAAPTLIDGSLTTTISTNWASITLAYYTGFGWLIV